MENLESPESFRVAQSGAANRESEGVSFERANARARRSQKLANVDARLDRFFGLGLSREIAAKFIGVSSTTFDVMVKDGRMPAPRRIGARKLWSRVELESAFDALPKDEDAGINPWDQDAAA